MWYEGIPYALNLYITKYPTPNPANIPIHYSLFVILYSLFLILYSLFTFTIHCHSERSEGTLSFRAVIASETKQSEETLFTLSPARLTYLISLSH